MAGEFTIAEIDALLERAKTAFSPDLASVSQSGRAMGFKSCDEVWRHIDRLRAERQRLVEAAAGGGTVSGTCPVAVFQEAP